MRRAPRTLIPNEGYELGWVKGSPFFNQPPPPIVTASGAVIQPVSAGPQNPTNEYPWVCRGYSIVIPSNVNPNAPLLLEDNFRNMLLLQNNSKASATGDIAPDLFIALDGPVQTVTFALTPGPGSVTYAYNAITLSPGEGLLLDTRVLGNALYFAWGAFNNAGGSVGIFGMCIYGRTLNSPPLQMASAGNWGNGENAGGVIYDPNAFGTTPRG